MKNLKLILIVFMLLSGNAFAENQNKNAHVDLGNKVEKKDSNNLNHKMIEIMIKDPRDMENISKRTPGFIDLNDDNNLSKREIRHKGKEAKKIYGDIETIGASVLIPKKNGYSFNPKSNPGGSVIVDLKFVQEDSSFANNSAKATFKFNGNDAKNKFVSKNLDASKIIFARLYWGGGISSLWNKGNETEKKAINGDRDAMIKAYFNKIKDFNTIDFMGPDGVKHRLAAEAVNTKWYGSYSTQGMQFMYQASFDVTDIVKASLGKTDQKRTFTAGNIKASNYSPQRTGGYRDDDWTYGLFAPHYGGWALSIVYDFETDQDENEQPNGLKARGVYIFDGLKILAPIHLNGQSTRIDSLETPFEGFFTPISGDVNSNLTFLSFGAKKEVSEENIEIKNIADQYNSVFSQSLNKEKEQFNSTLTRFDNHMNSNKPYNNQMDLDIFDISKHMSNGQTKTQIRLTANVVQGGGYTRGERANVGLVAFSTELYEPEVCYQENLFVKGKDEDDSKFRPVTVKGQGAPTKAKKDDILRVDLTIKNKGNEEAKYVSVSTDFNPDSMKYQKNTTYINNYTTGNFKIEPSHHVNDNTGLQTISGSNLKFFVGKGAYAGNGGTVDKTHKTFIRYNTTLNKEYKETGYLVKFSNEAINLEYSGHLSKCDRKEYDLIIAEPFEIDDFKAVNENFTEKGQPENLYTQLTSKPFDVNIVYFDKKLKAGEKPTGPSSDIDLDVKIVSSCDSNTSVIKSNKADGNNTIIAKFTPKIGLVKLENIVIANPYPILYFKLSYTDSSGKLHATCTSSDVFSVRPKEFKVYDTIANSILNTPRLIGGRPYPNIGLIATDKNDQPAKGYKNTIKTDKSKGNIATFTPQNPGLSCEATIPGAMELEAIFDQENGIGTLQKYISGATATTDRRFSFDEIGNVNLQIVDASYTAIDKTNNDCIAGSSTITKDSFGRIGCNIELTPTPFTFIPQDISIDNVRITNFQGGNMTYISNQPEMASTVTFNLTARLGDTARTTSRLYTNGCYSKQNSFTIGIAGNLPGFTDETGEATNIADAIQRDVIYSSNAGDANTAKKANTANNNGAFTVNAAAFKQGIATASINLNFVRRVNVAKNPFTVPNNIFAFTGVKDDDNVPGATYTAPSAPTSSSQFYYGIVYAPDYKGPLRGFNAKVYFGVFCNACNTTNYPIARSALLPSATNWFLNTTHNTTAQGQVNLYNSANTDSKTTITPRPNIANGIQIIRLLSASSTPVTDTIQMNASNWLIFNPANKNATFNTFNVSFTGAPSWGGRTMDSEGNLLNGAGSAGNVLESNTGSLRNYTTDKTNKRSNW